MLDFLSQLWRSATRRTLTYGIAVVSMGMGVAAFVCLSALSQSFAEGLRHKMLAGPDEEWIDPGWEFTLEAGPTIRVEVWPERGEVDVTWVSQQVGRAVGKDVGVMAEGAYDVKIGRHALNDMRAFAVSSHRLELQPHFMRIHGTVSGRLFTPDDDRSGEAVCVIGQSLMRALPEGGEAVGQTVKVNGRPFRVVGVVRNDDRFRHGLLLISFSAASPLLRAEPPEGLSFLVGSDEEGVESEMADVLSAVSRALGRDYGVAAESQWLDLEQARSELAYMRLFLGLLSLLPLVVGLLGMVSMLLANLNNRVREIGVHRALGATRSRQAALVLCEAGVTGLLASAVGIPVGAVVLRIVSSAWGAELRITPGWVVAAVLAGAVTSLLAGLVPARAAMRISPVEALRHE